MKNTSFFCLILDLSHERLTVPLAIPNLAAALRNDRILVFTLVPFAIILAFVWRFRGYDRFSLVTRPPFRDV